MIVFPSMLIPAALEAGMSIPDEPWDEDVDAIKPLHPHFAVFCLMQLGLPMPSATSHFSNAAVIASLSEEEVRTLSFDDIVSRGFNF